MLITYKYRLYPNKEQQIYFMKTFGCVRFIYNKMLSDKIDYYNKTKQTLNNTPAMYKNEYKWLREVDSLALANAQLNLQQAYANFFNNKSIGFPKFKSKKNHRYSYTTNNQNNNIRIINKYIKLPKIGLVKIRKHRDFDGLIKSVTIIKNPSNKYYISILVKQEKDFKLPKSNNKIGLDLGIKDFAITSNKEHIKNPKYLIKSQYKLKKLHKDLNRCKIGSKNREKCRIKIAKQYEIIANQRNDFQHKLSKKLINENQVICFEDLKIKEMLKNHILSKYISDVGWGEFLKKVEYKADWYDREILKVNTWFPSSQLCSYCGYKNKKLKSLHIREWICPKCNTHHDRDINSAINILNECLKNKTVGTTETA